MKKILLLSVLSLQFGCTLVDLENDHNFTYPVEYNYPNRAEMDKVYKHNEQQLKLKEEHTSNQDIIPGKEKSFKIFGFWF